MFTLASLNVGKADHLQQLQKYMTLGKLRSGGGTIEGTYMRSFILLLGKRALPESVGTQKLGLQRHGPI